VQPFFPIAISYSEYRWHVMVTNATSSIAHITPYNPRSAPLGDCYAVGTSHGDMYVIRNEGNRIELQPCEHFCPCCVTSNWFALSAHHVISFKVVLHQFKSCCLASKSIAFCPTRCSSTTTPYSVLLCSALIQSVFSRCAV
jgi:hypothetical protein